MIEFLKLVQEMREAQREYFKRRLQDGTIDRLNKAHELEFKVDVQLEIKIKELEKEGIELWFQKT